MLFYRSAFSAVWQVSLDEFVGEDESRLTPIDRNLSEDLRLCAPNFQASCGFTACQGRCNHTSRGRWPDSACPMALSQAGIFGVRPTRIPLCALRCLSLQVLTPSAHWWTTWLGGRASISSWRKTQPWMMTATPSTVCATAIPRSWGLSPDRPMPPETSWSTKTRCVPSWRAAATSKAPSTRPSAGRGTAC